MDLQPTLLQEPGEDKSTVQAVLRLIPCSVSLTLHIFLSRSLSFPLCLYLLSDSFSVGLFLSLNLCLRMTPCISISAFLLTLSFYHSFSPLCLFIFLFLLISLSIFLLLLQIFSLTFAIFFWDSLESCAFIQFYLFIYF